MRRVDLQRPWISYDNSFYLKPPALFLIILWTEKNQVDYCLASCKYKQKRNICPLVWRCLAFHCSASHSIWLCWSNHILVFRKPYICLYIYLQHQKKPTFFWLSEDSISCPNEVLKGIEKVSLNSLRINYNIKWALIHQYLQIA